MIPSTADPDTPRLEYAPAAPLRRRKRIIRATLFVLLVASLYVGWRHGPAIRDRAKRVWLERQCLSYAPGPDTIVFDNGSADAGKLAARAEYQPLIGYYRGRTPPPAAAGHMPACWVDYIGAARLPATLNPTGRAAVVFCHELTSATGVRRLVVIERGTAFPHYPYNPLNLDVVMVLPAGLTGKAGDGTPKYPNIRYTGATAVEPVPLYIFAGQPDPNDRACFTIRYRVGENEDHYVDGRLKDDGSDVTLTFRRPGEVPQ